MIEINSGYKVNKKWHFSFEKFSTLFQNKIYLGIMIIVFVKSLLFLGVLGTAKATGINFSKSFYSVPPYLIYLSFNMIILSFSFMFRGRGHLWALLVLDIMITILMIGDLWYYRGFSGFLNFFLLSQSSNLDNLESSIMSMARPIDLIFLIDIILFAVYICLNKELYKNIKRNFSAFLITLIIPVVYMTYIHYKVDVFERCFDGQMVFRQSWAPNQTMSNLGPVGYHVYDAYKYYVNTRPYNLSSKDKQEVEAWYSENREALPDNNYAGMFKGKNLLVIQWESLENFVVGQKIQGQEITPNLNRLLTNSLYFDNYHENVWNGTSSDSDLLTNAGVFPVREGSTFFRYPNNKYKHSLPKLMEGIGYSTVAIHPDKGSYWNWMPALQSIGFQKCIDANSFESKEPIGLGLSDHEFMEQVVPIIEKEKQPFYTFMVTLSSHAPFDLPEKYREMKLNDGFDKNILGDYFQSMYYTDRVIGKFLDDLEKKGILENTVVVIYGDHTSVNKFYPDKLEAVRPQEDWWMHNDMRIPLVIYNSSVKGETIETQGGQIDILPTLAYLMGVPRSQFENDALGKVLVNTKKNFTILQDFKMLGDYTDGDKKHAEEGIKLSDKMIQSNYFKGN